MLTSFLNQKHISCIFVSDSASYGSKSLDAIAFNSVGSAIEDLLLSSYPHKITVIGVLKINKFKGAPQIIIKDLIY